MTVYLPLQSAFSYQHHSTLVMALHCYSYFRSANSSVGTYSIYTTTQSALSYSIPQHSRWHSHPTQVCIYLPLVRNSKQLWPHIKPCSCGMCWQILSRVSELLELFLASLCLPYLEHIEADHLTQKTTLTHNHQITNLYISAEERVCVRIYIYAFHSVRSCSYIFTQINCSLHACVHMSMCNCDTHAYVHNTHARTHACTTHNRLHSRSSPKSKVIHVPIDFYGVFILVVLLNVMKVISLHHPFRFIFTTPVRILPRILTLPVKDPFLSM